MKRQMQVKLLVLAAASCMLMPFAAFGAQITQKNAESIAMTHAGVKSDDLIYYITKQDYENGRSVYDVEFVTNGYEEYDYEILAEDGTIYSMSCDAGTKILHDRGVRGPGQKKPTITLETAKATALAHAGVKEEDAYFITQRTDEDDGQIEYEIDFFADETLKYEYDIDSATGEIKKWGFDVKSVRPADFNNAGAGTGAGTPADGGAQGNTGSGLGAEVQVPSTGGSSANVPGAASANHQEMRSAMNAALERAGLSESQVRWGKVKRDRDDGRSTYEGKFYSGDFEYEFEYDIASGKIFDWDVESIYDD